MFKTLTLLPAAVLAWQQGSCPEQKSDVTDFNPSHMTGLWFEYVWTEGFQEGNNYTCSSWTVLENGGVDEPMIVFNQQMTDKEGDNGNFF
jgi:hypothetical protein